MLPLPVSKHGKPFGLRSVPLAARYILYTTFALYHAGKVMRAVECKLCKQLVWLAGIHYNRYGA